MLPRFGLAQDGEAKVASVALSQELPAIDESDALGPS